jgi:thioredoxin 1
VRKRIGLIVLLGLLTLTTRGFTAEEASTVPEVPVKDTVTMVDLGADKCIPCKLMAPILKDLQEEYSGKAAILFIDVWKHPEERKKFNVNTIPTQIFFDKDGKEIYRHEGFFGKDGILAILKKAGVEIAEAVVDVGR